MDGVVEREPQVERQLEIEAEVDDGLWLHPMTLGSAAAGTEAPARADAEQPASLSPSDAPLSPEALESVSGHWRR